MSTSTSSDSAPRQGLPRAGTGVSQTTGLNNGTKKEETREEKAQADPWAPVVLSLDGGGIRGLSELFLLRKIMDQIQKLIDEELNGNGTGTYDNGLFAFLDDPILLPCYFFDFMIGTSTGGLIAVMLGRLRMSVPDAIKAYWCLGNEIFLSPRVVRSYSSTKLKAAVVSVIKENCRCHKPPAQHCYDMEPLRQYDFAEENDISHRENPHRQNFTCKTALVAQRKEKGAQVAHLFRSYNHSRRSEKTDQRERNPMTLGRNKLRVWEACRASSAAPYLFPKMTIDNDEFLDGGAGNNNPSDLAWSEAVLMLKPVHPQPNAQPDNRTVAAMVSLGCGEKEKKNLFGNPKSLFFLWQAAKYGTAQITETEKAHNATRERANESGSAYFRFSVKPIEGDDGNDGLRGIKLTDCKRKPKNHWWGSPKQAKEPEEGTGLPGWYTDLQTKATPQRRKKGGFKPDKYQYPTFDTIFTRTENYCGIHNDPGEDVKGDIERCAETLLIYARARYADDPERWKCHVSHPDPGHPSYLRSTWRPTPSGQENGGRS